MAIKYLQLKPGSELPDVSDLRPFRTIVVIDEEVTPAWQAKVSVWLVESGCLYVVAWGKECSAWDDAVDMANMRAFDYSGIPDDRFVMTTWHDKEPLIDVFWFSKHHALHSTVELAHTLVLHVSSQNREQEFLLDYAKA